MANICLIARPQALLCTIKLLQNLDKSDVICPVLGIDLQSRPGSVYLVMPWFKSGNILDSIEEVPWNAQDALRLVSRSLELCHSHLIWCRWSRYYTD